MATELALAILGCALAAGLVFVCFAQARLIRGLGTLAHSHREDMRTVMNYAMNTSRVYSNEFLRIGVRSRIPEIDAAITALQQHTGGDRGEAVARYLAMTEPKAANGETE